MEPNEFEVYLDIDGAAEEDEDSVHSGEAVRPLPAAIARAKAAQRLAQISGQSGVSSQKSKTQHSFSAVTTSHSVRHHDSDTEEIDIDTPYDGKLMGQTNVKSETEGDAGLLHRLFGYARATNRPSDVAKTPVSSRPAVARKSTTAKKAMGIMKGASLLSVARKSTTQKVRSGNMSNAAVKPAISQLLRVRSDTGSRSNVAKKSTTKQPRQLFTSGEEVSRTVTKKTTGKNILQVKFGAVTAHLKKPRSVTGSLSPPKPAGFSPGSIASGKTKVKLPVSSRIGRVNMPLAMTGSKVFECNEKTGEKIPCPECSNLIGQWCMRAHLKTVHDLTLKICKKCKTCFTDLNLYSEHYALHLQEEEDISYRNYSTAQTMDHEVASSDLQAAQSYVPRKPFPEKKHQLMAERHSTVERYTSSATLIYAEEKKAGKHVNKKRGLSPVLVEGSSKFGRLSSDVSLGSAEAMIPELTHKPRKPGNLSEKWHQSYTKSKFKSAHLPSIGSARSRRESVSTDPQNDGYDSSTSSDLIYPVARQRPGPKSANRLRQNKLQTSVSNGRIRYPSSSPSLRSQSMGGNSGVTSNTSAQSDSESEECFSSDTEEEKRPASVHYKQNQKTAFRRGMSRELQQLTSPPAAKKVRLYEVQTSDVEDYKPTVEAVVSLVSLETASQPFDCETCWTAFQAALTCPRSFRQQCQSKPSAGGKYQAFYAHQSVAGEEKEEQDDETAVTKWSLRQSGSMPSQESVQPAGPKQGLFECPVCKETFQYRSMYLRHLPYHTFQYCCGICKKAFEEKVALMDHLQILHDGRMSLRCRYCEKRYEDVDEFEKHVYAHKSGTVVPCTVCNKKFGNARLMHLHSKVTHGVTQGTFIPARKPALAAKPIVTRFLSCRFCNKVFHKVQGLAVHYKLRHGISTATALSLGGSKKIISAAPQKAHGSRVPPRTNPVSSEASTQQDPGPSYSYGKSSATQLSGQGELSDMHFTAFKCKICDIVLPTFHGLKIHYRLRHKQDLPKELLKGAACFKCVPCNKWFSYRRSLMKHQKMFHAPVASVKSVVDKRCSKSPWQCKFCKKSFRLRKYMRLHVKMDHPRKYVDERLGTRKCTKCDKNFGSKNILVAHVKVCNVKRPTTPRVRIGGNCPGTFLCFLCKKMFRWKSNFVRHMEQHHGMSKEEIALNLTQDQHATAEVKKPQPKQNVFHICKVCKICFPKKLSFSRHVQRRHSGRTDIFQCRFRFCKKRYASNKSLLKHLQKFHPGKPLYRCQGCGSGFQYTYDIPGHQCEDTAAGTVSDFQDEDGTEMLVKECRYKCRVCGLGFYIAREWTKHVQEHAGALQPDEAPELEQDVNATDQMGKNFFSVMPISSVSKPRAAPRVLKMKKGKRKNRVFQKSTAEPVRCSICLKLFSPLSIRRHMMNIHSLPVKVCKICSIVFTDFELFRRHKENHKQSEAPSIENDDTLPAEGELNDNAVTLFICQTCGGLFNGADILAQHNCPANLTTVSGISGTGTFAGEFSAQVSQPLPVSIAVSQSLPAKASHEMSLLRETSQLTGDGSWGLSGAFRMGEEAGSHAMGFQASQDMATVSRSEQSDNPLLDSVSSMLSSIISLGSMIVKTEAPDDFDTAQAVHTDPVSENRASSEMGPEENTAPAPCPGRMVGRGDAVVSVSSTYGALETTFTDSNTSHLFAVPGISDSSTRDQDLAVALPSDSAPDRDCQTGISEVPDQVLAGSTEIVEGIDTPSLPPFAQIKGVDRSEPGDAEATLPSFSQADSSVLTVTVREREERMKEGDGLQEQAVGLFEKFAKQLDSVSQISMLGKDQEGEGHGADSPQLGVQQNGAVGSSAGNAGTETPGTSGCGSGGEGWGSAEQTHQVDMTSEKKNAGMGQISERIELICGAQSDKRIEQRGEQVSRTESLMCTAEAADEIILNLDLENHLLSDAEPVEEQVLSAELDKHLVQDAEPADEQLLNAELEKHLINDAEPVDDQMLNAELEKHFVQDSEALDDQMISAELEKHLEDSEALGDQMISVELEKHLVQDSEALGDQMISAELEKHLVQDSEALGDQMISVELEKHLTQDSEMLDDQMLNAELERHVVQSAGPVDDQMLNAELERHVVQSTGPVDDQMLNAELERHVVQSAGPVDDQMLNAELERHVVQSTGPVDDQMFSAELERHVVQSAGPVDDQMLDAELEKHLVKPPESEDALNRGTDLEQAWKAAAPGDAPGI